MSGGSRELIAFKRKLEALKTDVPKIMNELIIGEGVYAVRQAKLICRSEVPAVVNSGNYLNSFHMGSSATAKVSSKEYDGSKPQASGRSCRIDVYNNSDYAKPLEYGYRSHFVPGHWNGKTFVYQKNDPNGGMYVGPYKGFVRGHFTLLRAVKRTKDTQDARLAYKICKIINDRLSSGGKG